MYLYEQLIKNLIGQESYERLAKAIVKLPTRSVVDITEAADALSMAPKAILAFIVRETKDLSDGETKVLELPFGNKEAKLNITKRAKDVYSGHIQEGGKVQHEYDLCSIPQLSSHLLSYFEMYGDIPEHNNNDAQELKTPSDEVQAKLTELSNKIDQLFAIAAQNKQPQIVVNTMEAPAAPQLEKSDKPKKYSNLKKALKKGGLQPPMPRPPKAGTKVGGSSGTTQGGIHAPKTANTDSSLRTKTGVTPKAGITPKIPTTPAAPKTPSTPKTISIAKSEMKSTCDDCGHTNPYCICFRGLSRPSMDKSAEGSIKLSFGSDWDTDSLRAFYNSIKKYKYE